MDIRMSRRKERKKRYKIIGLAIILFSVILLKSITTIASSATIYFSSENPDIAVGEKVSVVITIESTAIVGTVEAYISYDPKILEFQTGGSKVSGADGKIKIEDTSEEENEIKKYSISFIGRKKGACEISLSDIPMVCDGNGEEMSLSSNRVSISVGKSQKSKDNRLKSLEISPGSLEPEFQEDVLEYKTTLPVDTKKLFLSTVVSNANATVEIKGADNLEIGNNPVVIKVIAESGDSREYKIMAKRLAEETQETKKVDSELENSNQIEKENKTDEIKKEDKTEEKETKKLDSTEETEKSEEPEIVEDGTQEEEFSVSQEEDNVYIQNKFRYEVKEAAEDVKLPDNYIKTKLILYGVNVPAYTLKNNLEADFLLLYAVNENGEAGFYQYDRIEKTMQRYSGTILEDNHSKVVSGKITNVEQYNQKVQQLSAIIAVLAGIIALLLIGIIRLFLKQRGYSEDDF